MKCKFKTGLILIKDELNFSVLVLVHVVHVLDLVEGVREQDVVLETQAVVDGRREIADQVDRVGEEVLRQVGLVLFRHDEVGRRE